VALNKREDGLAPQLVSTIRKTSSLCRGSNFYIVEPGYRNCTFSGY